ncbi:MAG: XRE family transcriptional regulator [Bacteroidetes bacterium]|nr:XRE family transcriptional regulator [Bacteroidota bacterium]
MKKVKKVPLDPRILAICDKIKDLRIAAGYTNYENFAWDHRLNRSHYHKVEKGHNMTLESFLKIIDAHGLKLKDFFQTIDL